MSIETPENSPGIHPENQPRDPQDPASLQPLQSDRPAEQPSELNAPVDQPAPAQPGMQVDQPFFPQFIPRMTLLERYGVSPTWFAILSLIAVFILYQLVGGILTVLAFGMKPSPQQVSGFRIATGIGQIIFILLPTLVLARLATFHPTEYFRLKVPDGRLLALPIIGIFSLQQVLQIMLTLQDKIPLPESVQRFIEPIKQMIEETYRMLVGSSTIPELLVVMVVVAFIPAICEEFLFRGLVQRSFETSFGAWRGVALTGMIFAAYHLNPFSFIPLALLGMYLGFLTMRSGSIWLSVIAHFCNNAIATVAVFLHYNDDAVVTGDPAKMTGTEMLGTFVLFGAIFALSTYVFIALTRKSGAEQPPAPAPLSA